MPAKPLEHYRLTEPQWAKTHGQGGHPGGVVITEDGETYTLAFGRTYKCSSSHNPEKGLLRRETIDHIGIAGETPGGLFEHLQEHS